MKYTSFALCLFLTYSLQAQSKKVLFIGNSYTAYNNLPQMTADFAVSVGDELIFDTHTPGGNTLMQHASNATALQKINSDNWDYVVLQAQSQEPSFPIAQVEEATFPFAEELCETIRANDQCTRPMFYMTWGRENGDQQNCQFYPPLCTYEGMDSLLNARYREMGESNEAYVSPVGAVWHYIRDNHPEIDLYASDGSHPSAAGSYAAACTFYTMIFEKDPSLATFDFSLSSDEATIIRAAAKTIVFDDLSEWNVGAYDPIANFTIDFISEDFDFNNTSQNTENYTWFFGDGTSSNEQNPHHTYMFNGETSETYTVTLIAERCGIADTTETTVSFDFILDTEEKNLNTLQVFPNPANDLLSITEASIVKSYRIVDAAGGILFSGEVSNSGFIDISTLTEGMYYIEFQLFEDKRVVRKFIK
ncbi:MAG: PKD repeat protein [Saprospiraceae bacterium]|jgi:PKD repeat protein